VRATLLRRFVALALLCLLLTLATAACRARPDPLARIRAAGMLRVALDPSFPPFEYIDGVGELAGLDVDLARAIAAALGVDVHFVVASYDGLYDLLTVGQADVIISALYPDPYRTQDFAFTPSYFNAGAVLVTRTDAPLADPVELAGKQVLVAFGTEGHMEALRWQELLDPVPEIQTYETSADALAALAGGLGDAAIVDNIEALTALAQGYDIVIAASPLTDESYVIAARRDEAALVRAIEQILREMQADGSLDTLIAQWMQ